MDTGGEVGTNLESGIDIYTVVVVKLLSCVQLFVTPWTVAHQAPLSIGFSSQEHWSGLPLPAPGDLPNPQIEPASPVSSTSQADSLPTGPSKIQR